MQPRIERRTTVQHEHLCTCSECHKLDRRFPTEGHQLSMFGNRTQRAPTEAEAVASLFALAGKAPVDRSGQRGFAL
jgi:cytochrome c peroxidase